MGGWTMEEYKRDVDSTNENMFYNNEIIERIKNIVPSSIDDNDVESRIKYIDKIESTIDFIENEINDYEDKKNDKGFVKVWEKKKLELNKCNFEKGTCEKKFRETFSDIYPELINRIQNDKNKKDGLVDLENAAISENLINTALNKIIVKQKYKEKQKQKNMEE